MQQTAEEKKGLALELLQQIHHYYPVGMPWMRNDYKGFGKMEEILTAKINDFIEEKETNWTRFINILKQKYGDRLFDFGSRQFPSYVFWIEVFKETNAKVEHTRTLVVNLSLLCRFFTVYYEDRYVYHDYFYGTHRLPILASLVRNVIFYEHKANVVVLNDLPEIMALLESHFEEHRYIYHRILFDYKVKGGYPGRSQIDEVNGEYPIYSFLFDDLMLYHNLSVMD